jgi:hypothetical protein
MSRLLQAVADFCAWSGMRIKREKSVATGFDFKNGVALPTEGILYAGARSLAWRQARPLPIWA